MHRSTVLSLMPQPANVATDPDDANKSMLDGNNLAPLRTAVVRTRLLTSTARWKIIFTSVVTNRARNGTTRGAYQTEWNALRDSSTPTYPGRRVHCRRPSSEAIDNGTQSGFPEMCVAGVNSIQTPHQCATWVPRKPGRGFTTIRALASDWSQSWRIRID